MVNERTADHQTIEQLIADVRRAADVTGDEDVVEGEFRAVQCGG